MDQLSEKISSTGLKVKIEGFFFLLFDGFFSLLPVIFFLGTLTARLSSFYLKSDVFKGP